MQDLSGIGEFSDVYGFQKNSEFQQFVLSHLGLI